MLHAKLSPSSSSRWLTCTASVEVGDKYENTTNDAASWGTCVHGIGELLLKDNSVNLGDTVEGMTVDKEMIKCAEEYVDYCRALMTPESVTLIEERFDLSFIAPDTFGTGDFTVLNDTHLHIVDLKTGFNIVDAENNTQLMLYALGAIHELEDIYDIEQVTLHIVQTRAGHISTHDVSAEDLINFGHYAQRQATKIRQGDVEFTPEAKACKWCPHATNCEALKSHVDKVVTGSFENLDEIEGKADLIDTEHMKKILDNADLIEGFIKAVKQVALERVQEGVEIKGYKIVESKTNRKWADEEEVAKYLNRKIKADDLWVKKLIPMSKILKLRPKDKKLQEMLVKPEGKPQLVKNSDKRPPLGKVCDSFEDIS